MAIVRDAGFHVLQKQTYVLSPFTLQSSRHWIDIVFSVDGVHMLANIVIANLIRVDLVLWAAFSRGVVTTIVIQVKDDLYHD